MDHNTSIINGQSLHSAKIRYYIDALDNSQIISDRRIASFLTVGLCHMTYSLKDQTPV